MDGLPKYLHSRLHWRHHRNRVPYHSVRHHIEYHGGQRVALGYPTVSLKGGGKVSSSLRYHLQLIPVCVARTGVSGSHAIYRQDVESPVPVQGIVRLMEIQGNGAKDRLTHGCYLMEQLSIGDGSTRPTSCPETMKAVILSDRHGHTPFYDSVVAIHWTSTNSMSRESLPPPFGISKTV